MDRVEAEAVYDAGREACVEFILELAARVERFEDRLRRLEEQARRDSRTSSKPPSQDPPKTRQQRRAEARVKAKELLVKDGAKRKAGGQDGHRGAGRKLASEDQVDEIVDHYPDACRGCGREFGEVERRRGGRFGRHQVAELPPISVVVVEHRTQRLRCPGCETKTVAELPFGVGESAFGSRLQAAIVTLTARHRVSRRGASELASDVFGIGLSTGAVDAICQRASDALADPHTSLRDWVLAQHAVHVDETGWRTAGDSRALWAATTPGASLFQIAEHCNREQFDELIGPFSGIVVSDRWPGYREFLPNAPRELNGFFAVHTVPPGPPFPEQIHMRKVCGIVWCYVGAEEDAASAMAPLLDAVPEPLMHGVAPMPYPALQSAFDGLYPPGDQWYWRADFVKQIPDAAIEIHARFGAEMPTMKSTMHMYPIDGAAHDPAPSDTAWSYRDANWASVFAGVDPDPANVSAIRSWSIDYGLRLAASFRPRPALPSVPTSTSSHSRWTEQRGPASVARARLRIGRRVPDRLHERLLR